MIHRKGIMRLREREARFQGRETKADVLKKRGKEEKRERGETQGHVEQGGHGNGRERLRRGIL